MTDSIRALSFLPDTAVLEITKQCNHSCLFCSCPWYAETWESQPDLDTDEWKKIILEFAHNGVFRFSFSGGECILRSDFKEILKFTSQLRIKVAHCTEKGITLQSREPDIVVLSNGRSLTRDLLIFFHSINAHLSISLPGITTFSHLTGIKGTAKHVLNCFKMADELGMQTTAAITVTKQNFFELYETISAALISGASSILLNRYLPGGRGLSHPELQLDYEEIKQIPLIAEEVLKQARRYGHLGTEYPLCVADPTQFHYLRIGTRCAAATGFFVIGPDGFIRVCNYSPIRLCHWSDWTSLMDIPYWRRYAIHENRPAECKGCSQYASCDGGCREYAAAFTKDHCGRDPLFEQQPQKYNKEGI